MPTPPLDKRQALLQAALKLFTEHGFDGTPTAKIAKEAGVATGTLFHYFETKENLINQLYLEVKHELIRQLSDELTSERTIRGKVYKLWCNAITWSLEHPEHLQFFIQFSSSPYISNLTREQGVERFRFLYDLIEEGQQQDVLKNVPTDLLFDLATGLVQVMGVHFQQHPDQFRDAHYRELAFSAYWDCIKR